MASAKINGVTPSLEDLCKAKLYAEKVRLFGAQLESLGLPDDDVVEKYEAAKQYVKAIELCISVNNGALKI